MKEVTIAYGMTETSPVSFQSSVDDTIERRVSTVGRVHPHVEVKVVDHEGFVVKPGQPGELLTRGYSVMLGYWDDTLKTTEAIDQAGWMHTGLRAAASTARSSDCRSRSRWLDQARPLAVVLRYLPDSHEHGCSSPGLVVPQPKG